MNKLLSLAAAAALVVSYNVASVQAKDDAEMQSEELAYAHEGDKAEMKGKVDKKAAKGAKKVEGKRHSEIKHHPHNLNKHKPHNIHNYYTDEQK